MKDLIINFYNYNASKYAQIIYSNYLTGKVRLDWYIGCLVDLYQANNGWNNHSSNSYSSLGFGIYKTNGERKGSSNILQIPFSKKE